MVFKIVLGLTITSQCIASGPLLSRVSDIYTMFEGKRAVGVRYLIGAAEERVEARARKEVLVCSGAIASPNSARLQRR